MLLLLSGVMVVEVELRWELYKICFLFSGLEGNLHLNSVVEKEKAVLVFGPLLKHEIYMIFSKLILL